MGGADEICILINDNNFNISLCIIIYIKLAVCFLHFYILVPPVLHYLTPLETCSMNVRYTHEHIHTRVYYNVRTILYDNLTKKYL